MSDKDDLIESAGRLATANFEATHGRVPDAFKLLQQHAPAAFAGYGLIRQDVMRDTADGGALDLRTKELIFAVLDVMSGAVTGAKAHAGNALRLGLTVEQLAEALVQCIMAGGITTWNLAGKDVLLHAIALSATRTTDG